MIRTHAHVSIYVPRSVRMRIALKGAGLKKFCDIDFPSMAETVPLHVSALYIGLVLWTADCSLSSSKLE